MYSFIMGLLFFIICLIIIAIFGVFAFRMWVEAYFEYKKQKDRYNNR